MSRLIDRELEARNPRSEALDIVYLWNKKHLNVPRQLAMINSFNICLLKFHDVQGIELNAGSYPSGEDLK